MNIQEYLSNQYFVGYLFFPVLLVLYSGGHGPSDGFVAIDKHTGVLTGLAETYEPSIVYVFLTPQNAPQGNPSDPCFTPLFHVQSIEITVTPATGYGYQGRDNALYLPSPTVQSVTGDDTYGYINGLGELTRDVNGYVYFTLSQLDEFDAQTMATYAADDFNGLNVYLTDQDGTVIVYLDAYETGLLTFTSFAPDTSTIGLSANLDGYAPEDTFTLAFTPNFRGNDNRRLEIPLSFRFSIA